ncbi:MAG TPA: hypothetical protein VN453_05085, partial [Feifaniaceae bacterium]|nr:hypothetical protein [Feifaniaceae bacterium]
SVPFVKQETTDAILIMIVDRIKQRLKRRHKCRNNERFLNSCAFLAILCTVFYSDYATKWFSGTVRRRA